MTVFRSALELSEPAGHIINIYELRRHRVVIIYNEDQALDSRRKCTVIFLVREGATVLRQCPVTVRNDADVYIGDPNVLKANG